MRLLVISHTPHYRRDGELVGWGPTVRELSYLAELFDELVHIAPVYDETPPASALPYASSRVVVRPVAPAGGPQLSQKLDILTSYPSYARAIRQEMRQADAVHVRCPANISLLALTLLMHSGAPHYRWVKYAGNWQPTGGEPWTYGLQRRWLRDNRHHGVVTVNGTWPDQPAHVYSFYNPSLTSTELNDGRRMAEGRDLAGAAEILFVGALTDGKGAGRALEVAHYLHEAGVDFRLHLLGDGPDRARYEQYAAERGLREAVFHGWVPRDEMDRYYATAHFVLLPSRSEGWPKVLSEGMAYGAVPIAGAVSSIPQVLQETGAGIALPFDDTRGMAEAIAAYIAAPAQWRESSRSGVESAHLFSYAYYQQAVAGLFKDAWGVQLPATPARETALEALGVEA